jgi:glycerol-3-phosphate acyltransferase PlsY
MDPASAAGIALAAGYLCGSVPFAWILVRARTGTDLRRSGSGNVGATNAARVLGRGWFAPLFALDAAKGAGAVLLAGLLPAAASGEAAGWVPVAGAAGAVLGHSFPAWLGFRGGKAVATGAGTLLALAPAAAAGGLLAFLAAAAAWRFVSLGSVAAAGAALLVEAAVPWRPGGPPEGARLPVVAFLSLLFLLVLAKHVPNLRRIAAGTEPRIGGPGAAAPGDGEARHG